MTKKSSVILLLDFVSHIPYCIYYYIAILCFDIYVLLLNCTFVKLNQLKKHRIWRFENFNKHFSDPIKKINCLISHVIYNQMG